MAVVCALQPIPDRGACIGGELISVAIEDQVFLFEGRYRQEAGRVFARSGGVCTCLNELALGLAALALARNKAFSHVFVVRRSPKDLFLKN
jgi:hypothetical protein